MDATYEPSFGIRLARFGIAGLLSTGMHVAVAYVLLARANAPPVVANTVAFTWATFWSYLLNTKWSFSSSIGVKNLYRFTVVSIGGVIVTGLVSQIAQSAGASPWFGIALVVCLVPPLTFSAHRFWTYR